jgi:hypothetical protein
MTDWSWTSSGPPTSFERGREAYGRSDAFGDGYTATARTGGRTRNIFPFSLLARTAAERKYISEFWGNRNGHVLSFYMEIPYVMYGETLGTEASGDGFHEDQEVGEGEGPIHLVRFVKNTYSEAYLALDDGMWNIAFAVRDV